MCKKPKKYSTERWKLSRKIFELKSSSLENAYKSLKTERTNLFLQEYRTRSLFFEVFRTQNMQPFRMFFAIEYSKFLK